MIFDDNNESLFDYTMTIPDNKQFVEQGSELFDASSYDTSGEDTEEEQKGKKAIRRSLNVSYLKMYIFKQNEICTLTVEEMILRYFEEIFDPYIDKPMLQFLNGLRVSFNNLSTATQISKTLVKAKSRKSVVKVSGNH